MKNQRMSRVRALAGLSVLLCTLALCLCAFSIVASAQTPPAQGGVASLSFGESVGASYDADSQCWVKTYDGVAEIAPEQVKLSVVGSTEENPHRVISASFIAPNSLDAQTDVGAARIRIVYEWDGIEREYTALARIEKRLLSWNDVTLDVDFTYDPEKTSYSHTFSEAELADVTLATLEGVLAEDAARLSLGAVDPISLDVVEVVSALSEKKTIRLYTSTVLSGEAASNYALGGIPVSVSVSPCKITEVIWGIDGTAAEGAFSFAYGDEDAYRITAVGKIGENDYRELIVKIKDANVTLSQASAEIYGGVSETPYVLYAESANADFFVLEAIAETSVTIRRAECVISASDAVFTKDAEHTPEFYYLPIQNPDNNVPAAVFARITYKFTADGVNFVDEITEPGEYTVRFFLHPDDEASYTLSVKESGENADGEIRVTLHPYRLIGGKEAGRADVIVYNQAGDLGGISVAVADASGISEKLLKKFPVFYGLTVRVTGAESTDRFEWILPVHSDLFSNPDTLPLTAADLYVLEGDALKPLCDSYTVTLSEDGSYYKISGIATDKAELSMTLLIAPTYPVSFWATIPGIALIAFLVLLFIFVLVLIGLRLIRVEKKEKNPVLSIDPEGGASAPTPAEAPEKLGSAEECIGEGLNALESTLEGTTAPEAPAKEAPADASAETAEVMGETLSEAAAISLRDDSDERAIKEAEELIEAMAEEKAKEFQATEAPAEIMAEAEEDRVERAIRKAKESLKDED